jgi:hypothetical protein
MRTVYVWIIVCLLPLYGQAQKEISSSGNWTDPGPWALGVPANGPTDSVVMDNSTAITIQASQNISSGSIASGNNNTITVDPSGELQVGDSLHSQNISAGTSMAIVANNGVIIIWGNLVVNTSLAITIQAPSGAIIIKGNLIMANNASIVVNGNLVVDGSFSGGTNTNVTVNGTISVYGPTSVVSGSVIGSGHFSTYGGCSGPPSFCSTLPVELLFFTAEPTTKSVILNWATASELNFDYFILEKSSDAKVFTEMTTVTGHGTSLVRNDYSAEDEKPELGITYYRLTEVDLDRTTHMLSMIEVNYTGEKMLTIFPNPVIDGQVTFQLNFTPESNVTVSIVDITGIIRSQFVLQETSLTVPNSLTSGIYLVTVQAGDFKSVNRMLVK